MSTLHKHDLLGLLGLAVFGVAMGWLFSPGIGFQVWVGATATVTVIEWLQRRRQRMELPSWIAAAETCLKTSQDMALAAARDPDEPDSIRIAIHNNVQAAERLVKSLREAQLRLS